MSSIQYILASSSPRRKEILEGHGIYPLIIPADVEENLPLYGGMKETVMYLALKKAKHVEKEIIEKRYNLDIDDKHKASKTIIISGDTIVYKDEIMGKPVDKEDGFKMLSKLRNTHHYVVTGVCLLELGKENARVFAEVTKVYFKDYSDKELTDYLDTQEAYDKAGGYAIQGYFSRFIDHIEGDYNNVVGLPWAAIERNLKYFK